MRKAYERVRNQIVTGFLFIMPVLICLVVLSRFWKHLLRVGGLLSRGLRIDTVLGPAGDAVAASLLPARLRRRRFPGASVVPETLG